MIQYKGIHETLYKYVIIAVLLAHFRTVNLDNASIYILYIFFNAVPAPKVIGQALRLKRKSEATAPMAKPAPTFMVASARQVSNFCNQAILQSFRTKRN